MKKIYILLAAVLLISCDKKWDPNNPFRPDAPQAEPAEARPASIGIVGDIADVTTTTKAGIVVMGGGSDVAAAFQWMISRSGGGDVVIIRATGTDAYNAYVKNLGAVNSVETLKIDSRKLADDERVATIIRNAEMLFIAGGDQSDYINYWKDTKVMAAINYLINEKKVPVGGTSAGAAILGNYYFTGERGTLESSDALANPYTTRVTLGKEDFLKLPFLQNLITDQHFSQRTRQGRMMAFLGRIMKDWTKVPVGIAVDEATAVCIDETGMANIVGTNKAFFLKTATAKTPETFTANTPVTWSNSSQAVQVDVISGVATGNKYNVVSFAPESTAGLEKYWWSVNAGTLVQTTRP